MNNESFQLIEHNELIGVYTGTRGNQTLMGLTKAPH